MKFIFEFLVQRSLYRFLLLYRIPWSFKFWGFLCPYIEFGKELLSDICFWELCFLFYFSLRLLGTNFCVNILFGDLPADADDFISAFVVSIELERGSVTRQVDRCWLAWLCRLCRWFKELSVKAVEGSNCSFKASHGLLISFDVSGMP